MISFAFDDGWKNHISVAVPILNKYNIKGTFYVMSRPPKSMMKEREGRLSFEDCKTIEREGHEIGSHSRSHKNLVLWFWKAKKEIFVSKKEFESNGITMHTFAYPYGWANSYVAKLVKRAGFIGARAYIRHTPKNQELKKYLLPTKAVVRHTTFEIIKNWIDQAIERKEWLILTFHDIRTDPYFFDTTPKILEEVCTYVSERKIATCTIALGSSVQ